MKKSAIIALLGSLALSSLSYAGQPTCENLEGKWLNELGATLNITSASASTGYGKLAGTYTSPSGTAGSAVPLIGWTNLLPPVTNQDNVKVVSFSVNWGSYGSVASWSGTCSSLNGKPVIKTIWNLVRSNSSYEWDHILINSDSFSPK